MLSKPLRHAWACRTWTALRQRRGETWRPNSDFISKERLEALLSSKGVANDQTIVLYGSYAMDAVTVKGYIGQSDAYDSTVIGIGADYDLGGAKLTGSVQDNGNDTVADLGVRFNF